MEEDINRLKYCFGSIPALYDDLRPSYPEEVSTLIFDEYSGTLPPEILEIGAGTGKATSLFAVKDCKITAIDLSQELIDTARTRLKDFSNIRYITGPFETLEIEGSYDIIFSAQAFHWIDQAVGISKVYRLLKENGVFALFWYVIRYQANQQLQNIRDAIVSCAPVYQEWPDASDRQFDNFSDRWYSQVSSAGYFTGTKRTIIPSVLKYSRERFLQLLQTFAWYQTLNDQMKTQLREKLIEIIGETENGLELPVRTLLVTGKKTGPGK